MGEGPSPRKILVARSKQRSCTSYWSYKAVCRRSDSTMALSPPKNRSLVVILNSAGTRLLLFFIRRQEFAAVLTYTVTISAITVQCINLIVVVQYGTYSSRLRVSTNQSIPNQVQRYCIVPYCAFIINLNNTPNTRLNEPIRVMKTLLVIQFSGKHQGTL